MYPRINSRSAECWLPLVAAKAYCGDRPRGVEFRPGINLLIPRARHPLRGQIEWQRTAVGHMSFRFCKPGWYYAVALKRGVARDCRRLRLRLFLHPRVITAGKRDIVR